MNYKLNTCLERNIGFSNRSALPLRTTAESDSKVNHKNTVTTLNFSKHSQDKSAGLRKMTFIDVRIFKNVDWLLIKVNVLLFPWLERNDYFTISKQTQLVGLNLRWCLNGIWMLSFRAALQYDPQSIIFGILIHFLLTGSLISISF